MLKHNSFFDGKVQSIGFERNGRRLTSGVIDRGEHHFNTDAPERMTITSGEVSIRITGEKNWKHYPAGTAFEVPGKSGFDIEAGEPVAYICEFL